MDFYFEFCVYTLTYLDFLLEMRRVLAWMIDDQYTEEEKQLSKCLF